ncbi:MAG: DUF5662 family protein [Lachnospiraceae bacterium]|nr:DUF5662 family protein [Lachnospiraceae bacterium]
MNRFFGHLSTIIKHRRLVRQGCFKVGLYWQGLTHDLSKFSPAEFWVGVKYFQGHRSPNNAEREATGVSKAWLHHKGRNKHHLEYWIDYTLDEHSPMGGMEMPKKYVVEMFMDRVAACKTYQKEKYDKSSPLAYYEKSIDHYMIHKNTQALLESMLRMLAEKGEEETFRYIRTEILKNRRIK